MPTTPPPTRGPRATELLALLSVVTALALSPSAWPEFRPVTDGALVAAAWIASIRAPRGRLAPGPLLAALFALLLAGHLVAEERPGSWDALAQAARIALALTVGSVLARRSHGARRLVDALVVLSVVLASIGAWQVFVSHPSWLAALDAPDPGMRSQLDDGRANGPFLLPAHFGAFGAAALPAALAVLGEGARRRAGARLAVGALGLMAAVATVALSGSFGAAVLLVGAVVLFAVLDARVGRAALLVALALACGLSLRAGATSGRAVELAAERPGVARSLNWESAARLVRERPVLGHGGGGFAIGSPRVRPAEANDSVRAHQGLLEVAVEHGVPALVLLAALLGALARRALRAGRLRGVGDAAHRDGSGRRAALIAAAGALLAHALVDFGWSDPGWAVPAALVLGAVHGLGAPPVGASGDASAAPRGALPAGLLVAVLAALVVAPAIVSSRTAVLLRSGRAHLEAGRAVEAWRDHRAAARLDPTDSRSWAGAAQASLALDDADRAVVEARRAVATAPRRAAPRAIAADALLAAGRLPEALVEAARAAQLAPHRAEHRVRRDRLAEALRSAEARGDRP